MGRELIIPDYPTYSILEEGFVRDLRTGDLKKGHNLYGYRQINLTNPNGTKSFLIHRLVADAFIPNPENKKEVDHLDRKKDNNSYTNLRWVDDFSQSYNRGNFKNNTSGYKHITCELGYFRVVITLNRKLLVRKRFMKLEDAVLFRDETYKRYNIFQ